MAVTFVEWSSSRFLLPDGDPRLPGESRWCSLIPTVHAMLAEPAKPFEFPLFRHNPEHVEATTYWEPALHILHLLLGWADAGKGLQAWYRAGKPMEDERLALLRKLYDSHGQLDLLARHVWEHGDSSAKYRAAMLEGGAGFAPLPNRPGETFLGREWVTSVEDRFPHGAVKHNPYHGGTNALHLGHGVDWLEPDPRTTVNLYNIQAERRAVLVIDRSPAWHRVLTDRGNTLPKLEDDRSWRIDVVVQPIGWMGTFRRSRETGLWFQGKHSVHMMGSDPRATPR